MTVLHLPAGPGGHAQVVMPSDHWYLASRHRADDRHSQGKQGASRADWREARAVAFGTRSPAAIEHAIGTRANSDDWD
jgi:hypothetical protein